MMTTVNDSSATAASPANTICRSAAFCGLLIEIGGRVAEVCESCHKVF
jgi:hypothetical protein